MNLKQLPRPAKKDRVKKAPESPGRIPERVYVDSAGRVWPWLCDQNPAMWLGGDDDGVMD